ncbi:hypothetical protein AcV7_003199 [Taiwanofungus camphoratus]|nr:hypothetical protein AcV7_003199 [Antrodia cinnamomea]
MSVNYKTRRCRKPSAPPAKRHDTVRGVPGYSLKHYRGPPMENGTDIASSLREYNFSDETLHWNGKTRDADFGIDFVIPAYAISDSLSRQTASEERG